MRQDINKISTRLPPVEEQPSEEISIIKKNRLRFLLALLVFTGIGVTVHSCIKSSSPTKSALSELMTRDDATKAGGTARLFDAD